MTRNLCASIAAVALIAGAAPPQQALAQQALAQQALAQQAPETTVTRTTVTTTRTVSAPFAPTSSVSTTQTTVVADDADPAAAPAAANPFDPRLVTRYHAERTVTADGRTVEKDQTVQTATPHHKTTTFKETTTRTHTGE
jgi:hypothetical protein